MLFGTDCLGICWYWAESAACGGYVPSGLASVTNMALTSRSTMSVRFEPGVPMLKFYAPFYEALN